MPTTSARSSTLANVFIIVTFLSDERREVYSRSLGPCYRRRRVEILEQLPERVSAVESQIVLLRDEMRIEFSATRSLISDVDRYMRVLHEDVIQRIAPGDDYLERAYRVFATQHGCVMIELSDMVPPVGATAGELYERAIDAMIGQW